MGNRADLIAAAKKKYEREQLVAQAKVKFAAENPPEADAATTAANVGRSALEGLTFGASEPVISGINAVTAQLWQAAQEAKDPVEFASKLADLDRLSKNYDVDVEARRKFEAENPTKSMVAETTGNFLPMVMSGGTGAAAKALPSAIDSTGVAARELLSKIPGVAELLKSKGLMGSAARIVESGAAGAAQGAAADIVKKTFEEPTGFIQPQDDVPSTGEAALFGAKFGAGMQAVPEIARQGARALEAGGKTAARVLTGVKANDIDYYLANPDRVRNAKSVDEIKIEIDSTMQKLRDDVENATLNKDQAKDAVKIAESKLDDLIRENKNLLANQKAEVRAKLREAQADFNIAKKVAVSNVKNARLPISADDVLDSVNDVKRQVSDLSSESYKILGSHEGAFSIKGVADDIKNIQNGLKTKGQLLSKDSEAASNVLENWKSKIEGFSDQELTAKEIKQVIQELDSDIRTSGDKLAGSFSDKTYDALMDLRRAFDSKIKEAVPGYSEIMQETAKMNQLRGQLAKMFGKRESVVSKLTRIDAPGLAIERQALKELGERTGRDFTNPLDEYLATKGQTRTPIAQEELFRSLPEHGDYAAALADEARTRLPNYGKNLLDRVTTASPEAQALRQAQSGLGQADEALMGAKTALDPFKKITPQNSENVIRTLLGERTRKIELKKLMASLGQVPDEDFVALINDLRVKDQFEKGGGMGSANTNLWAALSGGFGLAMGDPTFGLASAGAGASFGRFMDAYGGQVTKKVLDGIIFMRGIPTLQKVSAALADVPPAAVNQVKNDLIRMVTIGNSTGGVVIPADQRGDVAQDIKGAENLSNIEKANAINDMNKTGKVDAATMQKLMIGDAKPPPTAIPKPQGAAQPQRDLKSVTDFIKNKKQEAY